MAAGDFEHPGGRAKRSNVGAARQAAADQLATKRLPYAWLARRAVVWSRQARKAGHRELEAALLAVAAAAHVARARFRAERRAP